MGPQLFKFTPEISDDTEKLTLILGTLAQERTMMPVEAEAMNYKAWRSAGGP